MTSAEAEEREGLRVSDQEIWEDYFAQRQDEPTEKPRRWWVRILGAIVAIAILVSGATAAVQTVRHFTRISDPDAIVARAEAYAEESPFGFLVTQVRVEYINEGSVGAYVQTNPANGVVTIDQRPWEGPGLDRIMAHEIGHLIDFAVYGDNGERSGTPRRAGLEQEVWAECAAVAAGTQAVDDSSSTEEYRCTPKELDIFVQEMGEITEICGDWVPTDRCRPVTDF